jgi:DUF1009 family protein
MPSSKEWWVVGLGMVFIVAGFGSLPNAFTSMLDTIGVAIYITMMSMDNNSNNEKG